jgi:DNA-binding beta-propeller fold protein YncE
MSHDKNSMRKALQLVAMLAAVAAVAVGSRVVHAGEVASNVYTLRFIDAPANRPTAVLFDGRYIWVAIQYPGGGSLLKMTQSGALVSFTPVGATPIELAYDGANIWVTDYTSSDVRIVNANGTVVKIIPLPGAKPEGIVFDGKYVWIANNGVGANSVSKFDALSMSLMATYTLGRDPDGVAFDGTFIWVTNSYNNDVWKIDRNTGAYIDGYATGIFPLSIIYDGANMWIGNGNGVEDGASTGFGSVTKIRAADGATLGTYIVGNHVRGLVYDGTSVWVCNSSNNTVSRLRAADVALLGTYATGLSPRSVAFDGTKIWIANSGENSLTIIAPQSASPPRSGFATEVVTQGAVVQRTSLGSALNQLLAD